MVRIAKDWALEGCTQASLSNLLSYFILEAVVLI